MKTIPLGQNQFTQQEDDYLRENYRTMTDEELAEGLLQFGGKKRTAAQIYSHIVVGLLLNRRTRLKDHRALIMTLAKNGATADVIAEQCGCDAAAIRSFCRKNNIPITRKPIIRNAK